MKQENKLLDDTTIAVMKALCEKEPKNVRNFWNAGITSYDRGDFRSSIKYFLIGNKLDSTNDRYQRKIGDAYEALGKYDSSIYCYKRALSLAPSDAYIWNGIGICFLEKGNYDSSLYYFNTAIKTDKSQSAAFLNRINIYRKKQLFRKAEEDGRYILNDLKDSSALLQLAYVYYDEKNLKKALNTLEKYFTFYQKDPAAYELKGDILNGLGRKDSACANYEAARRHGRKISSEQLKACY